MNSLNKIVNLNNIKKKQLFFNTSSPFKYIVVDNFFKKKIALVLEKEFPDFNSKNWFVYKNDLEIKKALNDWNLFPKTTYKIFNELNSDKFANFLSKILFKKKNYLFPDQGLHGGGWHIQKNGGRLNPHLDYSIHPKLNLQRKINLIVYLNSKWKLNWGGEINLWKNSKKNSPIGNPKIITPIFNRAIIFDTTQKSWHGVSVVKAPNKIYRKSVAIYYVCKPSKNADPRSRALYAPTQNQLKSPKIKKLIKLRSKNSTVSKVYKF